MVRALYVNNSVHPQISDTLCAFKLEGALSLQPSFVWSALFLQRLPFYLVRHAGGSCLAGRFCQCLCLPGTLLWEQRSLSLLFAGTFLYRQWVTPSSSGTGFMTCLFLFRALYRNGMVARSVVVPFSPSHLFVITSGSYDGWSLISQLTGGCLEQH